MKETVEQFLARGGNIKVLASVEEEPGVPEVTARQKPGVSGVVPRDGGPFRQLVAPTRWVDSIADMRNRQR